MPSLYDCFRQEFDYSAKIYLSFKDQSISSEIKIVLNVDFAGGHTFITMYVPGQDRSEEELLNLLSQIGYGENGTKLIMGNQIYLPSGLHFPGQMNIEVKEELQLKAQFYGEEQWIDFKDLISTRRVIIYSETQLDENKLARLRNQAKDLGHFLLFRYTIYSEFRSLNENPLAFICHDSRDKQDLARPLASSLMAKRCPVWFDEWSLKIGDNLREKIELGLKQCKKCVLLISPEFLSNTGWTKKEFDSVFTKELLEKKDVILPVWHNVTVGEVYNYSPSLANKFALQTTEGIENLVAKIAEIILRPETKS